MEGEDKCGAEAVLPVFFENDKSAELVIASSGVLRAADGSDRRM